MKFSQFLVIEDDFTMALIWEEINTLQIVSNCLK